MVENSFMFGASRFISTFANWTAKSVTEFEEALIVRSLYREDQLKQIEIAVLLERHKSWVSRRICHHTFIGCRFYAYYGFICRPSVHNTHISVLLRAWLSQLQRPRRLRRGSGQREPEAPVCPQNRAYGSVHGSSCHSYPLIERKPMLKLVF